LHEAKAAGNCGLFVWSYLLSQIAIDKQDVWDEFIKVTGNKNNKIRSLINKKKDWLILLGLVDWNTLCVIGHLGAGLIDLRDWTDS